MFRIPLGCWFGVPVYLHWSWLLMIGTVLCVNPSMAPNYIAIFFLVVLHELGHCLAAKQIGATVQDIVLWPFGGIASIDMPVRPKAELFVAIAGPAVNAVLVPVLALMQDSNFCIMLGYYNAGLLIFNLLPVFPMDGGRVLRSVLTLGLKNPVRATKIAARIGQALCLVLAGLGLYSGAYMLVVIAVFISMAAQAEIRAAEMRGLASFLTGREVADSAEALRIIQRRIDEIRHQEE